MKNPAAIAIVEEYIPGFTKHPLLKMALKHPIGKVLEIPQNKLSPEQIAEIGTKLATL